MKNRFIKILLCLLVAVSCFVVLSAFASNEKESPCPNTECEYNGRMQGECNRDEMPCGKMQGECNRDEMPCGRMQGCCGRNCK